VITVAPHRNVVLSPLRASGGADVRTMLGCSWIGAISMAKKKKKAAKKVAKKKKGHG
jgi:hypothetical protein